EIVTGFQNTFSTDYVVSASECQEKHNGEMNEYFASKAEELLKEKFSQYEERQVKLALREILLSTFDQFWKDHLLNMDHLKEGINLRSYGQKDPLVEYKKEAFALYEGMKEAIRRAIVEKVFSVRLYTQEEI